MHSLKQTPTTFGLRLREARTQRGISQVELAKAIDMAQSTIAALEKGKQERTSRTLDIAGHLRVSAVWLEHGAGQMEAADGSTSGRWLDTHDLIRSGDKTTWRMRPGDQIQMIEHMYAAVGWTAACKAWRWSGDSLPPAFYTGDVVIVDTSITRVVDGGVYAVWLEDEAVLAQLFKQQSKKATLRVPNPAFPDRIVNLGSAGAEVVGQVVYRFGALVPSPTKK